jgi:hypothetical protein
MYVINKAITIEIAPTTTMEAKFNLNESLVDLPRTMEIVVPKNPKISIMMMAKLTVLIQDD